jgi:hypothetical protein
LVAWISKYRDVFTQGETEGNRKTIKLILKKVMPGRDSRWYKGASSVIYTYAAVSPNSTYARKF